MPDDGDCHIATVVRKIDDFFEDRIRRGANFSTRLSECHRVYGEVSLTDALAAHNGISDPDMLWAGKRLTLPPVDVLTASPGDTNPAGGDPAETPNTYRVREGDSLSAIARRFLGSPDRWRQLYELNRQIISNPDTVRAGTVLKIPAG